MKIDTKQPLLVIEAYLSSSLFKHTMDRVPHRLIGKCCSVSTDDIIIYSINAAEHIYHLRLVMGRLSEAGMKKITDDGKQKSMTYSSESEDSDHSLAGGPI